jgi:hypothetical protein
MEQPNYEGFCGDVTFVFDVDGSVVAEAPPSVVPVLNAEEQALADAVRRYQNEHRRAQLTWRDIFEIVHSLGYRKVEQPSTPPPRNGNTQDPARPDAAGNETPS